MCVCGGEVCVYKRERFGALLVNVINNKLYKSQTAYKILFKKLEVPYLNKIQAREVIATRW